MKTYELSAKIVNKFMATDPIFLRKLGKNIPIYLY